MEIEKKTYEISFMARTEEDATVPAKYLKQAGADILSEQQVEQVNLAYPIKKHNSAYLGCIHFAIQPAEVEVLRETLRFEEGILRYTIVTPPFLEVEDPQPRGPRMSQEAPVERQPASSNTLASNEDLEAKLEEISDSLENES